MQTLFRQGYSPPYREEKQNVIRRRLLSPDKRKKGKFKHTENELNLRAMPLGLYWASVCDVLFLLPTRSVCVCVWSTKWERLLLQWRNIWNCTPQDTDCTRTTSTAVQSPCIPAASTLHTQHTAMFTITLKAFRAAHYDDKTTKGKTSESLFCTILQVLEVSSTPPNTL